MNLAMARKVAVVCGAILAVYAVMALLQTVLAWAWKTQEAPMLRALTQQGDALMSEQRARVDADSLMVVKLTRLSRDRLELINLMETTPGSEARHDAIVRLRAVWQYEDLQPGGRP